AAEWLDRAQPDVDVGAGLLALAAVGVPAPSFALLDDVVGQDDGGAEPAVGVDNTAEEVLDVAGGVRVVAVQRQSGVQGVEDSQPAGEVDQQPLDVLGRLLAERLSRAQIGEQVARPLVLDAEAAQPLKY